MSIRIEPRVNGRATAIDVEPHELLLDVLRERLELTGAKRSCDVQVCGTCPVLVDGLPVSSCTYLAVEIDGRELMTIEGFRDTADYAPIAAAFTRHAALQCGFCTPAMLLTAEEFLRDNPGETDERAIREAISGVLCRCTGYQQVVEAIQSVAAQA